MAAGRYYAKSISNIYTNVGTIPLERPENGGLTFDVTAGSVTYIGNWYAGFTDRKSFRLKWDIETDYTKEPLLWLREAEPWITDYRVFVSAKNGVTKELAW